MRRMATRWSSRAMTKVRKPFPAPYSAVPPVPRRIVGGITVRVCGQGLKAFDHCGLALGGQREVGVEGVGRPRRWAGQATRLKVPSGWSTLSPVRMPRRARSMTSSSASVAGWLRLGARSHHLRTTRFAAERSKLVGALWPGDGVPAAGPAVFRCRGTRMAAAARSHRCRRLRAGIQRRSPQWPGLV